jgi:hypothetical protein
VLSSRARARALTDRTDPTDLTDRGADAPKSDSPDARPEDHDRAALIEFIRLYPHASWASRTNGCFDGGKLTGIGDRMLTTLLALEWTPETAKTFFNKQLLGSDRGVFGPELLRRFADKLERIVKDIKEDRRMAAERERRRIEMEGGAPIGAGKEGQ